MRLNRSTKWMPVLFALALVGCPETVVLDGGTDGGGTADAGSSDAGPRAGDVGEACVDGSTCESSICFPTGFGTGSCTDRCGADRDCLGGWTCDTFGGDQVCVCESESETCNDVDDDCDGVVDEGTPETIGCGEGNICDEGVCTCPAERQCGGACIDINNDPTNCGGCDIDCGATGRCTDGSCCTPSTETCNGSDDDCDGAIDEGSGAAVGCPAAQACVGGSCACPPAQMCGGSCVDTTSDDLHCGRCDNSCAGPLECVDSACCEAAGTRVDLLLMVDNSNSMTEEQAALAAELPRLMRALATGDIDGDGTAESEPVRDLHVGVITSDMGTGGFTVPTCSRSDFGDDGILHIRGAVEIPGCMATYPPFLTFVPGPGFDPDMAAQEFGCVAVVGTGGCGFEQQLEATLKAVTPSTSSVRFFRDTTGHGDGANDGFLRSDSLIVTLLVTDENDCSAVDPELYNPDSTTYPTDLNLRCFSHPGAQHSLTRYVDGLLALRSDPRDVIFAAITGVPTDLLMPGVPPDFARILSDPLMTESIDPTMPNRLIPSCDNPGSGLAFPPRRLVRVAQEIDARGGTGVLGSICQGSFADPIDAVLTRISLRLREGCAAP